MDAIAVYDSVEKFIGLAAVAAVAHNQQSNMILRNEYSVDERNWYKIEAVATNVTTSVATNEPKDAADLGSKRRKLDVKVQQQPSASKKSKRVVKKKGGNNIEITVFNERALDTLLKNRRS